MKANEYYMCKIMGGGGGDTPTGEISITANGKYNVSSYASADVAVPGPSGTTTLTYDANGTYTEDVSDYASAEITVNVSGGGGSTVESNDVNFYDYDGTLLYSYSASDFANLTSMPANPDRTDEGLTAQGWNWSLADAKAYVAKYRILDVGQMYITISGATEIDIDLQEGRISPYLGLSPNGTVEIDWGDGTAKDTVTGVNLTSNKYTHHIYAHSGKYTIKLFSISGAYAIAGNSNYSNLLTNNQGESSPTRSYNLSIKHIRLGRNVVLGNYAFAYCSGLETISMTSSISSIGNGAFQNALSMQNLVVPHGVTTINNNVFASLYSCSCVSLPNGITSIGQYSVRNAYLMRRMNFPDSLVTVGDSAFNNAWTLGRIIIPENVTSIGNAYSSCYTVNEIYSYPITPPTVSSLSGIPADCIIYVPSASLEAYQTETYWSRYASQMQGI